MDQAFNKISNVNRNYTTQIKDSNTLTENMNEIKSYLARTEETLVHAQKTNLELNNKIVNLTSENTLLNSRLKALDDKDAKIKN